MVGTVRSIRTPRTSKLTSGLGRPDAYRCLHESHGAAGREILAASFRPDGGWAEPNFSQLPGGASKGIAPKLLQSAAKTSRRLERINSITTMLRAHPELGPEDLGHSRPHFLKSKGFAPAGMGQDQFWAPSFLFQLLGENATRAARSRPSCQIWVPKGTLFKPTGSS